MVNAKKTFAKSLVFLSVTCYLLLTTCYLLPATPALAQDPSYDEVNEIAKRLNCPTCQGINLADCRTQTCAQWREQIADLLSEGYTEQEVIDYFSTQYGTQVLQEPPRSGFTLLLWVLPIIALAGGGAWLFFTLRRWSGQQATVAEVAAPTGDAPTEPSDDYLSQVERDLGLD